MRGTERLSGPRSSRQSRLELRSGRAAVRKRPLGNIQSAMRRQRPAERCRAGTSRAGVRPGTDDAPRSPLGRVRMTRPGHLSSAFRSPESTPRRAPVHNLAMIHDSLEPPRQPFSAVVRSVDLMCLLLPIRHRSVCHAACATLRTGIHWILVYISMRLEHRFALMGQADHAYPGVLVGRRIRDAKSLIALDPLGFRPTFRPPVSENVPVVGSKSSACVLSWVTKPATLSR